MKSQLNLLFALSISLLFLSCSSRFEITVTQDPNDVDLTNTETSYMEIKHGDPSDPGTILMKLQSSYSRDYNKNTNRIQFVYRGFEWTNLEYAQIIASFSTYTLQPLTTPEKKSMAPDGVEESFWVEIPKGVFGKIINSQKWSIMIHSQGRRFEFEMSSKDIENMESWLDKVKWQMKKHNE